MPSKYDLDYEIDPTSIEGTLRNTFRAFKRAAGYGKIPYIGTGLTSSTMKKSIRARSRRPKVSFNKVKKALGYSAGRARSGTPKQELKCIDAAKFTTAFRTPGAGTSIAGPINAIGNGPEIYQRVGRKVYMKSVQIKGFIQNAATSIQDVGRLFLIYDTQSNGAFPTVADVISDLNNSAPATAGTSMVNLNNRQRFNILRDHLITFPAVTNTAGVLTNGPSFNDTGKYQYEIDWFIYLRGREAVYNQLAPMGGPDITQIASGSLFLMFVSTQQDASYNFIGQTRLRYYD